MDKVGIILKILSVSKKSNKSSFYTNIAYAMLAQVISLLLSIIMALVVPKVLGLEEFSYWQLFLFYSGYSGFFHFGLNDGIYLREGGRDYNELDKKMIGTQFQLLFLFHCLITIAVIILSTIYIEDFNRRFVWIAAAISLPIINAGLFLGYVFQAVNKTKLYSISVIIDKFLFIIMVIILLILRISDFYWFVVAYLLSKIISTIYCIWMAKDLLVILMKNYSEILKEVKINITVGINLMLSNISSLLIVGNSRFIIDKVWGIKVFGTVSFSLLISTFFLSFISQISMVLFPTLRQVDEHRLKEFYSDIRAILGVILAAIPLVYLPLYYLVKLWLPQYFEGIIYLALLLPLITYEGKMNLLCVTYFKVLRKESLLLKINFSSFLLSLIIGIVGGFVFENVFIVIFSILISVSFKTIISEIHLAKLMGSKVSNNIILESVLVIIYLLSVIYLTPISNFIIYMCAYGLFLYYNRDKVSNMVYPLRRILRRS